ncbi:hypothetical protein JCM21900_000645 [Sporobolomyces salmonicolor]
MIYSTLLTTALAALGTHAWAAPQQQPFISPASAPHLLANSLSLPAAVHSSLTAHFAALPPAHLDQLAQHVHTWPRRRVVRLRANDGGEGDVLELTEGDKALLVLAGVKFVDVTDEHDGLVLPFSTASYPSTLTHNTSTLASLFDTINWEGVTVLHTELNPKAKVSFREFEHEWTQRSIIVRWEPKGGNVSDEVVIIGEFFFLLPARRPLTNLDSFRGSPSEAGFRRLAALWLAPPLVDSTNSLPFLRAPGADDDGSGTVTLVSVFSALLARGYAPTTNPLEFHFYSAEEGGLLGSGEIARSYAREGRSVRGMFHMDVVAFIRSGTKPVIGVIGDGVSQDLTEFMRLLISEYSTIPYANTACGYGCSDFASFTKSGYPSACLSEGKFEDSNPHMHSTEDVTALPEYSFEHITEFVKVGLGYAVELAGMEQLKK